MKTKATAKVAEYKKLPDEELVYRFVHRNENATLEMLFERYGHLILGICMKFFDAAAAKERTEAFFLQLIDDLKNFHIDDNFRLWLYNYVNKKCISKTQNAPVIVNNIAGTSGMSFKGDVTDAVMQLMQETLKTLDKNERECIEAFYLNNMTYAEIAKDKKLTLPETKKHIRAGLQTIKNKNEALNK